MRLFVAVEIPSSLRLDLGRRLHDVRGRLPKTRWVRPEGMHLTLRFLGETAADHLPALRDAFRRDFAAAPSMSLRASGLGAFPPRGRPRVVWCGLECLAGDLGAVQEDVAATAGRLLGLEPERRPFHPHVTLARCNPRAKPAWTRGDVDRLIELFGPLPEEPFTVREGVLFESELRPDGARYRAVETFPLEGSA